MSRYLLRLLGAVPLTGDVVPDAALLRRYTEGDTAAFELLVRRYADAVWAACRRVLRHDADAEDAFQTTFLVLARKAGSVRGASAGGWLHRVAVNAALKLKASGRREPAVGAGVEQQRVYAPRSPESDDLSAVHEELARLPDRYRLPVVLCDLEGHSRTAAAKVLGWPPGSVAGRLARARDILRDRLARRGLAPVVLVGCVAPSRVVTAAVGVAAGSVAASPAALSLSEGVLSAMRIARLKVAVALTVGLVAGVGAAVARVPVQVPKGEAKQPEKPAEKSGDPNWSAFPDLHFKPANPQPNQPAPDEYARGLTVACPRMFGDLAVPIEPNDDTYRRLLKSQLELGRRETKYALGLISTGKFNTVDYAAFHQTLREMRAVATELWANDPRTLVPWLEEFVVLAKESERFFKARLDAGTDPPSQLHAATRHRLAAEAALWKAKYPPAKGR